MKKIFAVVMVMSFLPALVPGAQRRRERVQRPTPQPTRRSGAIPTATPPAATPVRQTSSGTVHTVTVNSDGTFTPFNLDIKQGDTVRWDGLSRTDAVVQITYPGKHPESDVCGIRDNHNDHRFADSDPNEFTGPMRYGVSGVFALGPNGRGFKKRSSLIPCDCAWTSTCNNDPTIFERERLCPEEGNLAETLTETWNNPDITGVIIRLNWSDIQKDIGGRVQYVWNELDREMNRAVEHGKLFTLDVRGGKDGQPDWILTNYRGAAGRGTVKPLVFRDWGSGESPNGGGCGTRMELGSPVDPNYQNLYIAMINSLASHVASDSRWFQALAHVKISGANFLSSEARLPKRCVDSFKKKDADGKVDPGCICNTRVWADAGYTPEGLYRFYRLVGNAIYNAFYRRKSMGYQLIQDGFPRVESATNFEGDNLRDQDGNPLLPRPMRVSLPTEIPPRYEMVPRGTTGDDLAQTIQTETILEQGRLGRFVHPEGNRNDPSAGQLFVPQHSGLGRLPEDDPGPSKCFRNRDVKLPGTGPGEFYPAGGPRAKFPIPSGTPGARTDGCPNRWAVDQGTLYNQFTGFQTNNARKTEVSHEGHVKGVKTPEDVESALWNLTINSNGVFIEIYEERLWEISVKLGTGPTAGLLDPGRFNLRNNSAPFSKNLRSWMIELHDRRRELAGRINSPYAADPFPSIYEHTFSKPITAAQTYHYINPSKCATAPRQRQVGTIRVLPWLQSPRGR